MDAVKSKDGRGTPEAFDQLVGLINGILNNWQSGKIKFYEKIQAYENLFHTNAYGWSHEKFIEALRAKVGENDPPPMPEKTTKSSSTDWYL